MTVCRRLVSGLLTGVVATVSFCAEMIETRRVGRFSVCCGVVSSHSCCVALPLVPNSGISTSELVLVDQSSEISLAEKLADNSWRRTCSGMELLRRARKERDARRT